MLRVVPKPSGDNGAPIADRSEGTAGCAARIGTLGGTRFDGAGAVGIGTAGACCGGLGDGGADGTASGVIDDEDCEDWCIICNTLGEGCRP